MGLCTHHLEYLRWGDAKCVDVGVVAEKLIESVCKAAMGRCLEILLEMGREGGKVALGLAIVCGAARLEICLPMHIFSLARGFCKHEMARDPSAGPPVLLKQAVKNSAGDGFCKVPRYLGVAE